MEPPAAGIEQGSTPRTGACVRVAGRATLGATAGPLHASSRTADYLWKPAAALKIRQN